MASADGTGYPTSLYQLISYRLTELKNTLRFGGSKTMGWIISMLLLGGVFVWLDYIFFYRLIAAIVTRLEFLAPFMLHQLIHILFLSFFGLLMLSSMASAISGFYMSREIPFLITTPVSPSAFITQRFIIVFFQSAWMILIFGVPPFLAYSSKLRLGWQFVAGWFPVFILLVLIPVLAGSTFAMILMRILPAARVHQALTFMSLAVGAMIIILFRMSRPERLFMDVPTEEVMDFVKAMSVPEFPFMPTSWATEAVVSLSSGSLNYSYIQNLGLLLAVCVTAIILFLVVFRHLYFPGLSTVQEGAAGKKRKNMTRAEATMDNLPPVMGAYLTKDYLIFIRDPARWTQLFLLGALIVLYIYNAYFFPLGGYFYRNLVAFLNLALSGFVISALCVRFVYPSVSLEGLSVWITMSAPVSMKKFFLAKFIFAAVPLVLVSIVLTTTTNVIMGVDSGLMVLFGATSVAMALALVGLNLGMGAVFPRFNFENEAQIAASGGGVVTMIISLAYIGFLVVFMAAPVYRFFAAPMGLTALTRGDSIFGILGAGLLSFMVAAIPMGWGLSRVGKWSETN
ncbi:MAG: hypothetical protein V3S63_04835 [bacterium]